jgi:hypothetical protein
VEMVEPNTSPGPLAGQTWSTGCVEKKLGREFPATKSTADIHSSAITNVDSSCAEGPARGPPDCYDSMVCSIEGGALRRVTEAIDRLEADRQNTDAADLEARVAAVWSMVSEIDPELARLASGYDKPG